MISLTNYDFQWARSELVIIYPDIRCQIVEIKAGEAMAARLAASFSLICQWSPVNAPAAITIISQIRSSFAYVDQS